MTRRSLLKSLGCSVAAISSCVLAAPQPAVPDQEQQYGTITVDNCFAVTRQSPRDAVVFLNGRKVEQIEKIQAVNEREGWIETLERVDGKFHVDPLTQRIARVRRFGHVELRFKVRES